MSTTYYDILDVDADAGQETIRDAYRSKVKEYHPDVSDHPDAEERFKAIKRAEIVLTDPDERATYDRLGHDAYVDGDDPEPNQPTDDEVRWAAARAAQGEHDAGGGRSAGWRERERERRSRRTGRAEWFRENQGNDDPFEDLYADVGGPTPNGTSSTAAGSRSSSRPNATVANGTATDGASAASGQTGYTVHSWGDDSDSISIPQPGWTQDDVVLLVSSLFVYPLLLFLAAIPTFPMVARIAIGIVAIALVAFLLPRPAFGLPVFGVWSLLLPVFLLAVDVPLWSAVGIGTLGGTWLPLGYSIAVAMVLRR